MMIKTVDATFDGTVFWPDQQIDLEPNTRVCLTIEPLKSRAEKSESFLEVARSLKLEGPPDWSSRVD